MFSVLIVNVVRTRVFKIRVDEAVDLVGRDGDRRLWHRPVCRHVCLLVRVYPVCVMCAKGEDDELPCAPKVEPNLDNTTWESPSHRAATKLWRGIGGELSENESFDARTFHISSNLISYLIRLWLRHSGTVSPQQLHSGTYRTRAHLLAQLHGQPNFGNNSHLPCSFLTPTTTALLEGQSSKFDIMSGSNGNNNPSNPDQSNLPDDVQDTLRNLFGGECQYFRASGLYSSYVRKLLRSAGWHLISNSR